MIASYEFIFTVLAQEGFVDRFGEGFRRSPSLHIPAIPTWFLWSTLLSGTIGLSFLLARWWLKNGPRYQFAYATLATEFGLCRADRQLLNRVAHQYHLANAAGLLISRGTFLHYTNQFLQNTSALGPNRTQIIQRLDHIRQLLFLPS